MVQAVRTGIDEDCPPSSDKVLQVLEEDGGPMAPADIQRRTGLARRTVYVALDCLKRLNAIVRTMSLRDTRRRRYRARKLEPRN